MDIVQGGSQKSTPSQKLDTRNLLAIKQRNVIMAVDFIAGTYCNLSAVDNFSAFSSVVKELPSI